MTKPKIVEPDYAAEMALPQDKTCDDCRHSRRCFGFGFSKTGNTSCDFWPNRYSDAPTKAGRAEIAN